MIQSIENAQQQLLWDRFQHFYSGLKHELRKSTKSGINEIWSKFREKDISFSPTKKVHEKWQINVHTQLAKWSKKQIRKKTTAKHCKSIIMTITKRYHVTTSLDTRGKEKSRGRSLEFLRKKDVVTWYLFEVTIIIDKHGHDKVQVRENLGSILVVVNDNHHPIK